MEQEYIEKIKGYYDSQNEYKVSEQYSGEQGLVYIKENDKYHWLVLEQKDMNKVEVRQTNGHGKIITRDTYKCLGSNIKCTGMKRLKTDGCGMVYFSEDEAGLINRFGEDNKQATLASLKDAEAGLINDATKELIRNLMRKLSTLPDESCSELVANIKIRNLHKRNRSVKKRLADAEERLKESKIIKRNASNHSLKKNRAMLR